MAPQAQTTVSSTSTPAHENGTHLHQSYIPVALFVFLGLCLAYTFSYVLYRIVITRRLQSRDGAPDSSDHNVSQFMNGARLTLNFGNSRNSIPLTPTRSDSESPNMRDEEKPSTDSQQSTRTSEVPTKSPAESSSTPFMIFTPYFTMHPNRDLSEICFPDDNSPTDVQAQDQLSILASFSTEQSLSERIAAKAKTSVLSRDRAEAIVLDPKLAPVQGPLRPLSMVPSPSPRKRRSTLFGPGFKRARFQGGDPQTKSQAR